MSSYSLPPPIGANFFGEPEKEARNFAKQQGIYGSRTEEFANTAPVQNFFGDSQSPATSAEKATVTPISQETPPWFASAGGADVSFIVEGPSAPEKAEIFPPPLLPNSVPVRQTMQDHFAPLGLVQSVAPVPTFAVPVQPRQSPIGPSQFSPVDYPSPQYEPSNARLSNIGANPAVDESFERLSVLSGGSSSFLGGFGGVEMAGIMPRCPRCQKPNDVNSSFCNRCGFQLNQVPSAYVGSIAGQPSWTAPSSASSVARNEPPAHSNLPSYPVAHSLTGNQSAPSHVSYESSTGMLGQVLSHPHGAFQDPAQGQFVAPRDLHSQSYQMSKGNALPFPSQHQQQYQQPQPHLVQEPKFERRIAPSVRFGVGGIVVLTFPVQQIRYTVSPNPGQSNGGMTHYRPGKLHRIPLMKLPGVEQRLLPSIKDAALGLPLYDRFVKSKNVQMIIESMLPAGASPRRDEREMLLRLLQLMLNLKGGIAEAGAEVLRKFLIMDQQAPSELNPPVSSPPATNYDLVRLLLAGDHQSAVLAAVSHRQWDHALLIASHVNRETYCATATEFAKQVFPMGHPLRTMYLILAGQCQLASLEIQQHAESIVPTWNWILAGLLASRSREDTGVIIALGDSLLKLGHVSAAHICYLLADDLSLIDGLNALDGRIVLLNMNHSQKPSGFYRDDISFRLTEILEYALNQASGGKLWLGHLQAYKVIRANYLLDLGLVEESSKYCLALDNVLRTYAVPNPYITQCLLNQVKTLQDRISQYDPTKQVSTNVSSSDHGWLPKMGGLLDAFDRGLTKVIGVNTSNEPDSDEAQHRMARRFSLKADASLTSPQRPMDHVSGHLMPPTVNPASFVPQQSQQMSPPQPMVTEYSHPMAPQIPAQSLNLNFANAQGWLPSPGPVGTPSQSHKPSVMSSSLPTSPMLHHLNVPIAGPPASSMPIPQPMLSPSQIPQRQPPMPHHGVSDQASYSSMVFNQPPAGHFPPSSVGPSQSLQASSITGPSIMMPIVSAAGAQAPLVPSPTAVAPVPSQPQISTPHHAPISHLNPKPEEVEDLGFGNLSLGKDKSPIDPNQHSLESKEAKSGSASDLSKGTEKRGVLKFLTGWWGNSKGSSSPELELPAGTKKANLGEPNMFHYDEKLKRWVDGNEPEDSQATSSPPPPPSSVSSVSLASGPQDSINFRRGNPRSARSRYVDPLNPEAHEVPISSNLLPNVPIPIENQQSQLDQVYPGNATMDAPYNYSAIRSAAHQYQPAQPQHPQQAYQQHSFQNQPQPQSHFYQQTPAAAQSQQPYHQQYASSAQPQQYFAHEQPPQAQQFHAAHQPSVYFQPHPQEPQSHQQQPEFNA